MWNCVLNNCFLSLREITKTFSIEFLVNIINTYRPVALKVVTHGETDAYVAYNELCI
jgi:hypothetical protein